MGCCAAQTCVLQSTLHPTRALLNLERMVLPVSEPFTALHVRLGDGNMPPPMGGACRASPWGASGSGIMSSGRVGFGKTRSPR
jgi:hypothetical protein